MARDQLDLALGVFRTYEETRKYWYGLLRATGFRDLECGTQPDGLLRTTFTPPASREEYEEHARYYVLAERYGRRRKVFADERERAIWRLHAGGLTMREIVEVIVATMPEHTTYLKRVHEIIARHRRNMLGR